MYSQGYFIDVQICIVALYLLYITFFHRRITHGTARSYLLLLVPVSLLIPMIDLPLLPTVKSVGEIVVNAYDVATSQTEFVADNSINYYNLIYYIGFGFMSVWFFIAMIKIFILLKKSHIEKIQGQKIAFVQQDVYAFTLFNCIFINEKFRDTQSAMELIAHESEHVRMHHSFDLFYMSLLRVLFWFNPVIWHTQVLLSQIHEYQVDKRVIDNGHSLVNYINLLIKSEAGISPEFTSSFGYSFTKKRIVMLIEKKRINNWKRLFIALPVLGSLLFAFSLTTRASQEQSIADNRPDTTVQFHEFIKEHIETENPIYMLDGIQITKKDVDAMSTANVKNITILKNEAAAKIYGAEAAKRGVVIIESKGAKDVNLSKFPKNSVSTINLGIDNPLYIVDGYKGRIEDGVIVTVKQRLRMDRIESMTVLKDSVATAIYGKDGKNGVVIINTKDAKKNSEKTPEVIVTGSETR